MSTGADIRFGFLGAGMIATTRLAPAVHAATGAVLQGVASRDADRARGLEPVGRVHGGNRAYAELLDDPDIDAVYINLANEAHEPWTIRALEAGKHVLCEKPLALDAAGATAAFAAAADADRLLVEAFYYRWHPRTRWAERLVRMGDLGDVVRVDSGVCFGDADLSAAASGFANGTGTYHRTAARGGGALYDVGVYPLSVARWALPGFGDAVSNGAVQNGGVQNGASRTGGSRTGESRAGESVVVESVAVTWSTELTPVARRPVDLQTTARVRTPRGGVADIRAALSGLDEQSATVIGTEAVLTLDSPAFVSRDIPVAATISDPAGRLSASVERFQPVDPYRLMIEAVAGRIRGEDTFVVPAADSLAVARVSDAIRREGSIGE